MFLITRMNILIHLMLLKCYLFSYCVARNECNCTPISTDLEKFHNQVLKRRTRSIVFPNKANLLLTPAFTKAVLDGRPRGLSYSVEFDMYSPLPDTIENWQPTVLVNKIKKQQQRTSNTAKANILQNETTPSVDNILKNALGDNSQNLYDFNDYYQFRFNEADNINSLNYFEPEWNIEPRNLKSPVIKRYDHFHKLPLLHRNFQNNNDFDNKKNYLYQEISWQHHNHQDQSFRERRQLLEQFEAVGMIFKFNMKACIKKAMCEITNNLKPYGESLIEDIIRLILIIPNTARDLPEHQSDPRQNYVNVNCEQFFALSCPYRVIDYLTKNIKANIN